MKEQQNITIKIANQSPIPMTVPRSEEEAIRKAERGVNELWRQWRDRFKDKTPMEVMALVAFQFARFYYNAQAATADAEQLMTAFEKELDDLLNQ